MLAPGMQVDSTVNPTVNPYPLSHEFCIVCSGQIQFNGGSSKATCYSCGTENMRAPANPPRMLVAVGAPRMDVQVAECAMQVPIVERALRPSPAPLNPFVSPAPPAPFINRRKRRQTLRRNQDDKN